mmetsp:Transcript_5875/g.12889  ORF Transcript_5875/g.12889 Transcript_5875/m.12889 type:complete len:213 (+) Transcript_5875:48-686(+)
MLCTDSESSFQALQSQLDETSDPWVTPPSPCSRPVKSKRVRFRYLLTLAPRELVHRVIARPFPGEPARDIQLHNIARLQARWHRHNVPEVVRNLDTDCAAWRGAKGDGHVQHARVELASCCSPRHSLLPVRRQPVHPLRCSAPRHKSGCLFFEVAFGHLRRRLHHKGARHTRAPWLEFGMPGPSRARPPAVGHCACVVGALTVFTVLGPDTE